MLGRSTLRTATALGVAVLGIAVPVGLALGHGGSAEDDIPQTLAEAQELYDPDDDPNIVVGPNEEGTGFTALDVSSPLGQLPKDVKTIEDLKHLGADLSERFEKEHPEEAARVLEALEEEK